MLTIDEAMAAAITPEHVDKPFFGELLSFITSGPVVAMAWSGPSAISVVRAMMGPTDPQNAPPGTIRGDHRDDHHGEHRPWLRLTGVGGSRVGPILHMRLRGLHCAAIDWGH